MSTREVVPGVFMVGRTWGSNVYILRGPPVTIVDAGFSMDENRIARCFGPDRLDNPELVVLTHCHFDHMGSLAGLKSRFDARAAAHVDDAAVIEGSEPYQEYKVDFIRHVYYKALGPMLFKFKNAHIEEKLEEGDTLEGGLRVLRLGGHTTGSIALHQPERGILFTGDVIRNEKNKLEGPPPQFSIDMKEAFLNIRDKVLDIQFESLLPGHGEPIARGARGEVRRMMIETGRPG